jgi:choline-sulfatase
MLQMLQRHMLGLVLIAAAHAADAPGVNVVLISIDTLRADHLGSYGYRASPSPTIDRLAREGTQFDNAFTSAPLTLPAHASMLTGLYPGRHGIHDNGEILPASVQTLAEAYRAGGYKTAAFIGSFILDRRFGLSRGFEEYWGSFDLHRHAGEDPGAVQIRGDQVERAAEDWVLKSHSGPFFLFVHFYDLHGPFLLPKAWRDRYPQNIYDGEIGYVDSLIARLWSALGASGLSARTLLVITADHGEGLGEHGERNHGMFVYHSTTRIPLIVRFPDGRGAGKHVASVVRLIDIAPTLLAGTRLPPLQSAEGTSLLEAIDNSSKLNVAAYSETVYPFRHFHAAPLLSLTTQDYSFIQAPRSELYANKVDFAETHNIATENRSIVADLREKLRPFADAVRNALASAPAPDILAKLKSLGYVGGASGLSGERIDPKDQIATYSRFQDALELEASGRISEGIASLKKVVSADPALLGARIELGLALQRIHKDSEAVEEFEAALRVDPKNALAHYNLCISLGNLRNDEKAERECDLAATLQPSFSRAFVARGLALARLGKLREAIASLDAGLSIDPEDFDGLYNRGNLLGAMQQWADSRRDLLKAVGVEPNSAPAHVALGTLDLYTGDQSGALREYQRAVALDPRSSSAHSSLGLLYRRLGQNEKAAAELVRAIELDPNNQDARQALQQRR